MEITKKGRSLWLPAVNLFGRFVPGLRNQSTRLKGTFNRLPLLGRLVVLGLLAGSVWLFFEVVSNPLLIPVIAGLAVLLGRLTHTSESKNYLDEHGSVIREKYLSHALDAEIARSRRFNHSFALVLVRLEGRPRRFLFRDPQMQRMFFLATAKLLNGTRIHVDHVFRYGDSSFALLLPECGPDAVRGLVHRLQREQASIKQYGERQRPLPLRYGATFFPQCAATSQALIKRAEIALAVSMHSAERLHCDNSGLAERSFERVEAS